MRSAQPLTQSRCNCLRCSALLKDEEGSCAHAKQAHCADSAANYCNGEATYDAHWGERRASAVSYRRHVCRAVRNGHFAAVGGAACTGDDRVIAWQR